MHVTETPAEVTTRLRREAAFQNARVEAQAGAEARPEPRSRFYYLSEPAFDRYHDALRTLEGKDVLVVGCSADAIPAWLMQTARVTGVDIADEAVGRMNGWIAEQGLGRTCRALVMNGEDLTFPDRSFDAIVCSGVLHHLDTAKAAASWARCLRPGGRVIMLEPMAWNPVVALYRFATPSMRTPDEHPLVPRDFRILARSFATTRVEAHAITTLASVAFTYVGDPFRLSRRTMRPLAALDRLLLRLCPPLRYVAWTAYVECGGPKG
ncbi:MAG: hypothetical protein HMLKMBBP_01264 [Planctomycetes bacterium]|nr:hypothetical protein [Planctomycetota bacterium]